MNNLYNKVYKANLKKTLENKGYAWFSKGVYNLNIIGVRKKTEGNKVTNLYDDILVVVYNDDKGKTCKHLYNITTEPGAYYMHSPCNVKGTAILVPNQYRGCWKLGLHKGQYTALVQAKPVKVYRDGNKDNKYDLEPKSTSEGMFGINIHRSNLGYTRNTIDMYSAGCQVFNNPTDFSHFISLCKKQKEIYGDSFTYTLINEEDLC